MILEHEQWCFGYDQILKDCRVHGGSVVMLCNADVDAMASARILSYMLRSDGVHYQLLPCHSYQHLVELVRELQDVRALLLLNFGACYNLTKLYNSDMLEQSTKTYVLDCRRPIHLANVYAPSSVVVFLDSTQKLEDMPSDGENLSGHDSSSSSESDSDSDDSDDSDSGSDDSDSDNDQDDEDEEEANFDDVVGESNRKQSEKIDPEYDAEDEDEDDNHEDDDDNKDDENDENKDPSPREAKRQKIEDSKQEEEEEEEEEQGHDNAPSSQQPMLKPRDLHKYRSTRLRQYYTEGSFFGSPSSFVAYSLATQNRFREQGDLLWLACVGVTDAYLHARLDLIGYARLAKELSTTISKLYPSSFFDRALNTVYAEDLQHTNNRNSHNATQTKIALSENGRILSEKDFRFFLLRHSSLLDSMQYSDYVCTKLQLYTKQGEQRLLELLAKMGYPLDECKQPFCFMRPSLRRRLKQKLATHAKEYNLDRFEFTSFTRVTGYSSLLSASDTSHAVTALLEYEAPSADGESSTTTTSSLEAFHNAYDALGSHCSEPLMGSFQSNHSCEASSSNLVNGGTMTFGIGQGLKHAMVLQKSILHTAIGLVERGGITLLRHFRYAHVTSSSTSSNNNGHLHLRNNDLISKASNDSNNKHKHNLFSKPLALTKLAHFLMDMNRENEKWTGSRARPLLLIADKPPNSCLIVGYEYPERSGDFVRNKFGKHFELTAKSMNGQFRFDSFDSNVVEVGVGDAQRFLEQLHYLMDAEAAAL